MYEIIFNKITQDVINEVESRIQFIIEDSDGELTHDEAEVRACEAILDQADDMGLFHMFEFILKEAGYWPYALHLDNPYDDFRQKKSEAQDAFEKMIGVSDLSNLLTIKK